MNIFKNWENVVAFPLFDSAGDFWGLARKISHELGEHKHLLNEYLSEIFEISSHVDLKFAIESADKICAEVLIDCYRIVGYESEKGKYFSLSEKYINENPVEIKDLHTRAEYYATTILSEHLNIFADDFFNSLKERFSHFSFSNLNHYYQQMAKIVGEDRIEYLNDLMIEAFFMCPAGVAFVGQITSRCIEMLVYYDFDTLKQIFEIILEDSCDE